MDKNEYKMVLERRVTVTETKIDAISEKLEEITNNHLVHLNDKIDRITWLLVITLVSILANLLSKLIKL